jgi:hypothetical protein
MRRAIHPDFPDYFVRDDGLVERRTEGHHTHPGDVLKGRVLASGYRQFKLVRRDGKQAAIRANRLVCGAFHGAPRDSEMQAAHRNGRRLDDRPENLYWATPQQNKHDSIRHGTSVSGRRVRNQHGDAKLSPEAVAEIRATYTGARGDLIGLARKFGVGRTCIKNVLAGATWASEVPFE